MEKTQQQILRHHGGDGEHAREMITQSYERRHDCEFWEFWNQQMAGAIQPDDVLLDLGAGIGQFVNDLALRYPQNRAIGIEAAEYMLVAGLKLPENGRLLRGDLLAPQNWVDQGRAAAVMANMLLHELPQPVTLIKAVYHWLKPGGRWCIIDLVRQPLQEYLDYKFPDKRLWDDAVEKEEIEDVFEHFLEHNRYHAEDLIYMLEQAGFELVEQTPMGRMTRLVVEKPLHS
ncbi:class I SAM-dependent methyltransferase [Thiomicrorhabdus xiamenensis]|uniref:Class I SAM-dependent methyltransferase n=1 Tax=Thiomicrorhabdus xiamenensis TaxID=2739063 RepID=A0A7D4T9M9_9GAMM|nr:class I SAM-dependent methyltransferase [Thiomicrorhabdus xiamenensis]QKI88686.1 class I SAM-dependent methyltransferase [Thiomicrorhabdus xiamenensis]